MVNGVYARCLPIDAGEVATYIPELSKANPNDFGICVATADGRVFEAGTCDRPFTIQSISKPFTFGMALEQLGHDKVFQHVGAATLSNMGCHPITGRSTFTVRYVKDILSIMFTCGMYDYSGHWAYRVGVPAKSGVGGGCHRRRQPAARDQLGISTYSPRLDRYGNSCRATAVCVELASQLGLHVFDCLNSGSRFLDAIL
jgi:glutaminase